MVSHHLTLLFYMVAVTEVVIMVKLAMIVKQIVEYVLVEELLPLRLQQLLQHLLALTLVQV